MLFGNRYSSYRSNSDNMLSTLILLILLSFLAYYAYNNYVKKSDEESALTNADEKQINALVKKCESDIRAQYAKDQADREDTNGVCSDKTSKNKYECINKHRCSIPEIVEQEACLKTAGARWYPHEWTSNVAAAAATVNADTNNATGAATDAAADAAADATADAATDATADATAAAAADATVDQSTPEGFLTGASSLLDEPFMAYNSGSSLVGADLTESFMPFNELN